MQTEPRLGLTQAFLAFRLPTRVTFGQPRTAASSTTKRGLRRIPLTAAGRCTLTGAKRLQGDKLTEAASWRARCWHKIQLERQSIRSRKSGIGVPNGQQVGHLIKTYCAPQAVRRTRSSRFAERGDVGFREPCDYRESRVGGRSFLLKKAVFEGLNVGSTYSTGDLAR